MEKKTIRQVYYGRFKSIYCISRLKKKVVLCGSICRGYYSRLVKHITTNENNKRIFTNKRQYWGKNQKYHKIIKNK